MAEKLSVEIALEGGKEVEQQLTSVGEAGSKAFESIDNAAQQVDFQQVKQSLGDLANAANTLGQNFTALGEEGQKAFGAISQAATQTEGLQKASEATAKLGNEVSKVAAAADKAAPAFRGLNLESAKTASEIAKNTAEIIKYGVEIGLAIQKKKSLGETLLDFAGHATTAVRAVTALGIGLTGTTVVVGGVVLALGGLALALGAVGAAAARFVREIEETNHKLRTLSQTSGESFEALQRGEAAFKQIGISADTVRASVTKISEALASLDVGSALQKSADKAAEATNKVLEAERALLQARVDSGGLAGMPLFAVEARLDAIREQLAGSTTKAKDAEKALAAAREEQTAAYVNQLNGVVAAIEKAAEGQKGITFDPLVKAETKVEALQVALKKLADEGKGATDQLLFVAKVIENLPSLKDALALGKVVGFSETEVDRIRRYGAEAGKLENTLRRLAKSGPLITPETSESLDDVRTSAQRVQSAWERLDQAWSSSAFTKTAADIATGWNNIKASAIEAIARVLEEMNKLDEHMIKRVTEAPAQAWQWLVDTFNLAVAHVKRGATALMNDIMAAIGTAPAQAWAWIVDTFNSAIQSVYASAVQAKQTVVSAISAAPGEAWRWIVDTFIAAAQYLYATAQAAWQAVVSAISAVPGNVWAWITQTFDAVVQSLQASAQNAWNTVVSTLSAAPGNVWQWVIDSFNAMLDGLIAAAMNAGRKVGEALGFSGGGAVGGGSGFARGGMVGGRGSGTSDSNLAWVSRGEHIMPARAVRQPGVLAFLEALRRSGGNLTRVLDGMGRFALGGLVPRMPLPAFAQGGLNGGMSNVTIQFPGLPAIGGLRASSEVVDELRKAAALAQIRSGGRKPSRYS